MFEENSNERLMRAVRTVLRIQRILQQVCEEQGYTLQQYRTLTWLSVTHKARPCSLAEQAAISRPAAAAMINGLQSKKLVLRKSVAQDGRGVYLLVTKKAKNVIANLEMAMIERLKEVFGMSVDIISMLAVSADLENALDALIAKEIEGDAPIQQPLSRKKVKAASASQRRSRIEIPTS